MERVLLIMAVVFMSALQLNAQTPKVEDKELIGTWVLECLQWDGEEKVIWGKGRGYSSFKYYGADGEYACCEVLMTKNGDCVLAPHEYGTYTFKDGVYCEMGRPSTPNNLVMTSKTSFKGRWRARTEIWKKVNMPEKASRYIVDCCRMMEMPADIQQMMKPVFFR